MLENVSTFHMTTYNKKAQLWLRNPRDAKAFQIHPEEIHTNDDDDDDGFIFKSPRNEHSVHDPAVQHGAGEASSWCQLFLVCKVTRPSDLLACC